MRSSLLTATKESDLSGRCDNEQRIRNIAARATPLWDRLLATADKTVPDLTMASIRLERWRQVIGSADLLDRRLLASELSSECLDALLGGAQAEAELPTWASTLAAILHAYGTPGGFSGIGALHDRSFDLEAPLPFQEALVGFVYHARAQFAAEAGLVADVLCPSAVAASERQLLGHLTFIANLTLGRDFYEYRFERAPAAAMEFAWTQQGRSTEIYSSYVLDMYGGRLIDVLEEYPVLARLLCQSVIQWKNSVLRLCQRFLHNFPDLRKFFGWEVGQPFGAVADLRMDLSDRHHGGQTVIECILATSERVIYKPRGVQSEVAFSQVIHWMNEHGLSLKLSTVRALDFSTHGWVKSVVSAACQNDTEVDRFYARMGMLLAILHLLAITDVHCENLIASGQDPVVVDLETLFNEGRDEPRLSVLRTGLLPRWQQAPNGLKFDMSALAADSIQDTGLPVCAWKSVNTDQMTLVEESKPVGSTTHRVRLAGRLPTVSDRLLPFLRGFEEAYSVIVANRHLLLADSPLLHGLDHLELRVLVRDTATYGRIQLHLLHPEFLRDGLDRSIELEWLARPLSAKETPQKGRALLYDGERMAMEELDIPHFGTSFWRQMEHGSNDQDMFNLCGDRDSRVLLRRLAEFGPTDFSQQHAIVEDAVRSRFS